MIAIPSRSLTKRNLTLGVCCFCLGLACLSLWKSNQVAQTFDVQQRAGIKGFSLETPSRPCSVAVTNSVTYHYEVLESIASQLPLHHLTLNDCDTSSVVFDFFIVQYRSPPKGWKFLELGKIWKSITRNPRSVSWMSYFETEMKGKQFVEQASPEFPTITRTIGKLVVQRNNHEEKPIVVTGYDATVEASCPCSSYSIESLQHDTTRSCLFHETCPAFDDHPRAVWISPYHDHFFLPTELPKVPLRVRTTKEPLCLCVIGAVHRRSYRLLQAFLEQISNNNDYPESRLSFRIQILGAGKFPDELRLYRDQIQLSAPPGYWEFHHQVGANCDAMLLLLTKTGQPQYFSSPGSLLRLTGAIPLVVAYHMPVLLHEELYAHYEKVLPSDLVAVTHTDETSSFLPAMWDLLDQLRNTSNLNSEGRKSTADIKLHKNRML